MNYTFNKKQRFFEYFPHITLTQMKTEFELGFFEQGLIRDHIQQVIRAVYDRLVQQYDLMHVTVYPEIGDEFDMNFYQQLKTQTQQEFHNIRSWEFLDRIMPPVHKDEENDADFYTKLVATLGRGPRRQNGDGPVLLKEALVTLINYDLDVLNGRELLYLTKVS